MNPYNQPYFGRPMYSYGPYPQQMQQVPQQMQQMQPMQSIQPMQQPVPQPAQTIGLQGKSVDSVDVVKAMDIPLDGSVSYFPLADGTAIVTKQLQMDGTSKTVIYKPIDENDKEEKKEKINYITPEVFNEKVKMISEGNNNVQDGIASIQEQIESLSGNLKDLANEMKSFRGGKK